MTIVVQVDGRARDRFTARTGITEEAARTAALERPAVERHMAGRAVVYVPDRVVNIVTEG